MNDKADIPREDKRKIVIAEDSVELCDVLSSILNSEGYIADYVHDGFALLDYLKKNQDVEAIILDLMMPKRNGTSIFDTIRSVTPATKIIIYTGYTNYQHTVFAKEADAFINKAEGVARLLRVLDELLV